MIIVSNVKKLMNDKNVTIHRLQELTGLSSRTIHNARGDQIITCTLATLTRFAEALGCSTKDLFHEQSMPLLADIDSGLAEAAETPEKPYRNSA